MNYIDPPYKPTPAQQRAMQIARRNTRSRQFISQATNWVAGLAIDEGDIVQSYGLAWTALNSGTTAGTAAPNNTNGAGFTDAGGVQWVHTPLLLVAPLDPGFALAIDGYATASTDNFYSLPATLTTKNAGDVIIVAVHAVPHAGGATITVAGIADTAGLTWQKRKAVPYATDNNSNLEVWWTIAPAALTGDVITASLSVSGGLSAATMIAFGISGANTPSPWDTNSDLPKGETFPFSAGFTEGGAPVTATNAMGFGFYGSGSGLTLSAYSDTLIASVSQAGSGTPPASSNLLAVYNPVTALESPPGAAALYIEARCTAGSGYVELIADAIDAAA